MEENMIIIENKKILSKCYFRKNNLKYPWDKMKINDSFLIDVYSQEKQACLLSCAKKWSNRHDKSIKWASRKDGNALRIYRIA